MVIGLISNKKEKENEKASSPATHLRQLRMYGFRLNVFISKGV